MSNRRKRVLANKSTDILLVTIRPSRQVALLQGPIERLGRMKADQQFRLSIHGSIGLTIYRSYNAQSSRLDAVRFFAPHGYSVLHAFCVVKNIDFGTQLTPCGILAVAFRTIEKQAARQQSPLTRGLTFCLICLADCPWAPGPQL